MDQLSEADRLAQRLNLVPVSIMAAGYLAPLMLFWGAVFGPLRPLGFAPVAPVTVLLGSTLCCAVAALGALADQRYFELRAFEAGGRVYHRVGVRWIRRFISNGDLINRVIRARYPHYRALGADVDLARFEAGGRAAERAHLVLLLGGLASSVFAARLGEWGWAGLMSAGNVVANLLPIILQRYNRGRVSRIRRRNQRSRGTT